MIISLLQSYNKQTIIPYRYPSKKLSISCDLHLQDLSLFVIHKTQITRYQRYSYDS